MLDAKKASPDFVPDIFSSDGTGPLSAGGSAGGSARGSRRFSDGFSGCGTSSGNGNDDVRIVSHFYFNSFILLIYYY